MATAPRSQTRPYIVTAMACMQDPVSPESTNSSLLRYITARKTRNLWHNTNPPRVTAKPGGSPTRIELAGRILPRLLRSGTVRVHRTSADSITKHCDIETPQPVV